MDSILKFSERKERISVNEYYPEVVKYILGRLQDSRSKSFNLVCYTPYMRWIARVLRENKINFKLYDMDGMHEGYDLCGESVARLEGSDLDGNPIVICSEVPSKIKQVILYLAKSQFSDHPVIYENNHNYNPLRQDHPFSTIIEKAEQRAKSMISDAQLLDLIQLIKMTKHLDGAVAEFGSLYGGSGAVLAEALEYYGKRKLYLCDTFDGIPSCKYGFDSRWDSSFADNSYLEVSSHFKDLPNVDVIKGDIFDTALTLSEPLSMIYVGTDTYGSAEFLFKKLWPKLQSGGVIHVCDHGSYPNALPITAFCDQFERDNPEITSFRTSLYGIFFIKN